jgi:uncharacterized protein YcnI
LRPRACAALAAALAITLAVTLPAAASAHAEMTPMVALRGTLQLYSLAVPTEKEGAVTTKVVLTVPPGFAIDSFAPSPGWQRTLQQSGSGESAVIQQVTWTGGRVPTGEDSVFQFLAQPAADKTYTFVVQQTYSDGQVVTWNGPESSDTPAPTVAAKSSLGGGGGGFSTLSLIALIVAVVALLASALALAGGGGSRGDGARPLA